MIRSTIGLLAAALFSSSFATTFASCSSDCRDIFFYGLDLTVTDTGTGEPICDATVVARNDQTGATQTIVSNPASAAKCPYFGLGAGLYTLSVSRDGYSPVTRQLQVPTGECDRNVTQRISIALVRSP